MTHLEQGLRDAQSREAQLRQAQLHGAHELRELRHRLSDVAEGETNFWQELKTLEASHKRLEEYLNILI